MGDLREVGGEEQEIDRDKPDHPGSDHPTRLAPERARDGQEEDRVDQERAGDSDPLGGRELRRRSEAEHDNHDQDEQRPVHGRQIDLPDRLRGRVLDSTRGRKPSWTTCRVTENAPEMTACDAISVAQVASTIIGTRDHSGIRR